MWTSEEIFLISLVQSYAIRQFDFVRIDDYLAGGGEGSYVHGARKSWKVLLQQRGRSCTLLILGEDLSGAAGRSCKLLILGGDLSNYVASSCRGRFEVIFEGLFKLLKLSLSCLRGGWVSL